MVLCSMGITQVAADDAVDAADNGKCERNGVLTVLSVYMYIDVHEQRKALFYFVSLFTL